MIIEVRRTGTHNKGAELMLQAIRQYFCDPRGSVQLAVEPRFGAYADRARYGLLTKAKSAGLGRGSLVQRLMSPGYRQTYGIVVDSEVDATLDAAGFAYGDQWGPGPTRKASAATAKSKRQGRPVVLLPQAFGPFSTPDLASHAKRLVESSSLVFARDPVSYSYVQNLGGPYAHVRQAPDFTSIVKGVVPPHIDLPENYACVIPNIRMLDRTSEQDRQAYVGFLAEAIRDVRDRGVVPIFLFHVADTDADVARAVEALLGFDVQRIDEQRPEYLKGILGKASLVIGSRFHGLVGALSQGVPSIVAGWSHKYEALLRDYGCPEMLLAPTSSRTEISAAVDRALSTDSRESFVEGLRARSNHLRRQVDEMFTLTAKTIGVSDGGRHDP